MSDATDRGSGDFVTEHLYKISLTAWKYFFASIKGLDGIEINSIEDAVKEAEVYGESYAQIFSMSRTVALFDDDSMAELLINEIKKERLELKGIEKTPTNCDHAIRAWIAAEEGDNTAICILEKLRSIIADKVYLKAPSFSYRFPAQEKEWSWTDNVRNAFQKLYEEWASSSGARSPSLFIFIPASSDSRHLRIIIERCARHRNAVDYGANVRKAIPYDPLKVDSIDVDFADGQIFIRCQEPTLVKRYAHWIQITLFENAVDVQQGKIFLQRFREGAKWLKDECCDSTLIKASVSNIALSDGKSRVQITRDIEAGLSSMRDFACRSNILRLTLRLEFSVSRTKSESEVILLNSGDEKPSRLTTGPRQSQVQAILQQAGIWTEPEAEPWDHWQTNRFTRAKSEWRAHCGPQLFAECYEKGILSDAVQLLNDELHDEPVVFYPEKQNELLSGWLELKYEHQTIASLIYFIGVKEFKHGKFALYCPYRKADNSDERKMVDHAAKIGNFTPLIVTPREGNGGISSLNLPLRFPMCSPGNLRYLATSTLHMLEIADPTYWAPESVDLVYSNEEGVVLFWLRDDDCHNKFLKLELPLQSSDVLSLLVKKHGSSIDKKVLENIIGEGRSVTQVIREIRNSICALKPSVLTKDKSFLKSKSGAYKLTLVCDGR